MTGADLSFFSLDPRLCRFFFVLAFFFLPTTNTKRYRRHRVRKDSHFLSNRSILSLEKKYWDIRDPRARHLIGTHGEDGE